MKNKFGHDYLLTNENRSLASKGQPRHSQIGSNLIIPIAVQLGRGSAPQPFAQRR